MQPSPPRGTAVGIARTEILQRTKRRVAAVLARKRHPPQDKNAPHSDSRKLKNCWAQKTANLAARFQNVKCFAGGICQRRKRLVRSITQQLTRLHRRHRRVWACLIFFLTAVALGSCLTFCSSIPVASHRAVSKKKTHTHTVTTEKAANTVISLW